MAASPKGRSGGNKKTGFSYIVPAKRRATQYEEITLHTQWDPKNFAQAGWFNLDKNGNPPWREDSTRLKATDWWAYRDPHAEWFRPFVKRQADIGRSIEQSIAGAKRAGNFANFDAEWVDFLSKHYAAYRFAEYGLFLALCQAQREAGSDVVAQPIIFQSVEKDRHAQDITLYGMVLEAEIPGFSDSAAKDIWMNAPEWQGLRKIVEYLLACRDWAEIYLVVNFLIEPLVSTLLCRELIQRNAPLHGDAITPTIAQAAEADRANKRDSSKAFIQMVLDQHPDNRMIFSEWAEKWLPLAISAAQDLIPLFSLLKHQTLSGQAAYDNVYREFCDYLAELGIEEVLEKAA